MNWFKVLMSGGIGLLAALAVMFLVEKCGGVAAEVADSIPSVIVPIAFILLIDTDKTRIDQANSLFACPIGVFATNICFMIMWKIVPAYCKKRNIMSLFTLIFTVISALVSWFIGAFALGCLQTWSGLINIPIWLYAIIVMALCVYIGSVLCIALPPPMEKQTETCCMKIFRSVCVIVCVIFSSVFTLIGPIFFKDFFNGFPAIFSSSIVSVSFAQVALLPTGELGPMILAGCSSGWFTLLCGFIHMFTKCNPIVTVVISHLIIMFCWSTPVFKYIQWRREVTEENIKKNTPPKKSCWSRQKKQEKEEKGKGDVEMVKRDGEVKKRGLWLFSKKEEVIKTGEEVKKEEVKKEEVKKDDKVPEDKKPEVKKSSSWNPFKKDEDEVKKPEIKKSSSWNPFKNSNKKEEESKSVVKQ